MNIVIDPEHHKPSDDGLTRVVVDTHDYFGGWEKAVDALNKQTGMDWLFLGCYMDHSCFATHSPITKKQTVTVEDK